MYYAVLCGHTNYVELYKVLCLRQFLYNILYNCVVMATSF